MNCPECGARMWRYNDGWRCRNDHYFETTSEGLPMKVIRVDRPTARERLMDFALGTASGGTLVVLAVIALDKL